MTFNRVGRGSWFMIRVSSVVANWDIFSLFGKPFFYLINPYFSLICGAQFRFLLRLADKLFRSGLKNAKICFTFACLFAENQIISATFCNKKNLLNYCSLSVPFFDSSLRVQFMIMTFMILFLFLVQDALL